ncbi:hypothetical protein B0H34DRAFT_729383 [Crassisporium funariophilum]|nr:hypothetical protein B0H34DRAFT_729383 [Crassisporium funariophilum]
MELDTSRVRAGETVAVRTPLELETAGKWARVSIMLTNLTNCSHCEGQPNLRQGRAYANTHQERSFQLHP